jgi:hypothetical protein
MHRRSTSLQRACTGGLASFIVAAILTPAPAAVARPTGAAPHAVAAAAPSTAQGWTDLFQDKNDLTWSGADQATSIKAANGAIYWLFGDTVLGTENPTTGAYNDGARMIANTILMQRGSTLSEATSAGVPAIPHVPNPQRDSVPNNGDENDKYWPIAAVEHGTYLNVFAQRVRVTPGQGEGFELVGSDLARFRFSGDNLVFVRMSPTPSSGLHQRAAPQWGGAAIKSNGYVYVYGHKYIGHPLNPHATYLARVPVASMTTSSAWRYWDGARWAAGQAAAAAITDSQPSSVAIINGKWTLLCKPWNGAGDNVHARTSDHPYGPFTSRVILSSPAGTTPEGRNYITYGPVLHPEQSLASGAMLVSVSWNGRDFWNDVAQDADLYKPRFHEVQM